MTLALLLTTLSFTSCGDDTLYPEDYLVGRWELPTYDDYGNPRVIIYEFYDDRRGAYFVYDAYDRLVEGSAFSYVALDDDLTLYYDANWPTDTFQFRVGSSRLQLSYEKNGVYITENYIRIN